MYIFAMNIVRHAYISVLVLYVPNPHLGIYYPWTMSLIPLVHTFSVEDVPDPLRDLCPTAKNHANAALIKFPLSNQKIGGLGHQTVLTLNLIVTLTSLYHAK